MTYNTLITTKDLLSQLKNSSWVIIDCRFQLGNLQAGFAAYKQNHIPGALYAHLEDDLSGPITEKSGRHPLPQVSAFKKTMENWGIGDHTTQIVCYDDSHGGIASRLWWMLRFMGCKAVAVLDGGFQKWTKESFALKSGVETVSAAKFTMSETHQESLVDLEKVKQVRTNPQYVLIDSRASERYLGKQEPIDPVAGHIPGAKNHCFKNNLNDDETMLGTEKLQQQFAALLGDVKSENSIFYCGSGVTACQNLLAMEVAGLHKAKLFVGSWSQWCKHSELPVEKF